MLKWLKSAGKLTSLLAVSPASHTALRAGGKGARTSATCGPSSHASSEKSDPLGYLLRTSLASGLQQRTRCSLTWTRRATPAGRSWWVLTTLGRPTAGSACGLSPGSDWPTAKAADGRAKGTGGSADHGLDAMARKGMLWPTHTVSSGPQRADDPTPGQTGGTTLAGEVLKQEGLWARPQARDWRCDGNAPSQHERHTPNIHARVIRLSCEAGPHDQAPSSASGKLRDWPTAQAMDVLPQISAGALARAKKKGGCLNLREHPSVGRGSLNPAWVAQLMGAPDDWLASDPPPDVLGLRPLVTGSSHRSSRKSAAPSSRRKSIFATFLRRKQGI